MANQKHKRILLLNELGNAVVSLRRALILAEENEWDEFYILEEIIENLIDASNLAEL